MGMTRRGFLKAMLAAAAAPAIVKADSLMKMTRSRAPVEIIKSSDVIWDIQGKTIRYVGCPDKTYSVLELYRWLQEQADNAYLSRSKNILDITNDNPSRWHSNNYIELVNGYTLEDSSLDILRSGAIREKDRTMIAPIDLPSNLRTRSIILPEEII